MDWRRLVEWLLVALVVLVLLFVFERYIQQVQRQSELAAVKTTLGALRTALVLDHLQRQVLPVSEQPLQPTMNPFELVAQRPVNYAGLLEPAQADLAPAGSWVYAAKCRCVGYRPFDAEWLGRPSSASFMWFEIIGMPGVMQLAAKERYRWDNEFID